MATPRAGESLEEAEARATARITRKRQTVKSINLAARGLGLGSFQPTEAQIAPERARLAEFESFIPPPDDPNVLVQEEPAIPPLSQSDLSFLGEATAKTGVSPTTQEGQQYVFGYLNRYGVAPSPEQLARFKSGLGPGFNFQFLQGSAMARLGFKNAEQFLAAQRVGQQFGPQAGDLVPRGGLVLTEDGKPSFRTFDLERFGGQIRRGEFIEPTSRGNLDELFGDVTGFPDPGGANLPPAQEFGGTLESALANFAPTQVYQARLTDFLDNKIKQDAFEINKLVQEYERELDLIGKFPQQRGAGGEIFKGKISEEEKTFQIERLNTKYIDLVEQLMTEGRADEIKLEAESLIAKGTSAEELPLFTEIQATQGATTQDLINQGVEIDKKRFEEAQPPPFTGGAEETQQAQEPQVVTGNEEREFHELISEIAAGVPPSVEQFLRGRFFEYWNLWKRTGQQEPFIQWLRGEIAGG